MREVKRLLSNRLLMVADLAVPCEKVFDIGTDHCYLPVYLVQKGICKAAVATDIKEGPVRIAKRNVRLFGMEKHIDVFVADGMNHVEEGCCVIIAGMGADVIVDILKKDMDSAKSCEWLILQCQSKTERLRAFLWDNGFAIEEEALINDRDKIYNAFRASYTGINRPYTETDTIASEILAKRHHPLLPGYVSGYIKKLDDMIAGYREAGRDFTEEIKLKRALEELL